MTVKDIIVQRNTMHFKTSFKIAYEEVGSAEVVIIKVIDQNNNIGLGSASVDTGVTGENIEGVFEILKKKLIPDFFDCSILNWYRYHEKIQDLFSGFPSAQSTVEEAVLNLWSKSYNVPLVNLFGGHRDSCETMITVGIKDKKETLDEVKNNVEKGFKIIKLKCGFNAKEDIEKIINIKKIIPENCKLTLDANQGYTFIEAKNLLSGIEGLGIALIEQPIDSKDIDNLKKLHLSFKTPIVADESIVSIEDAVYLMKNDYVSGVNVKLMKCGGPINFVKIFHLAKSLNKVIMLGCMYESNISITMGASLALALPIDFVDLDSGHLDFTDDPAIGGAEVNNGLIKIGSGLKLRNDL